LTSTSTHGVELDGDVDVDPIVDLDLDHFGVFPEEDSLN
jgi:hypothetical protein